MFALR
jgi:hypothetical protein